MEMEVLMGIFWPLFVEEKALKLRRNVEVVLPIGVGDQAVDSIIVSDESTDQRIVRKLLWLCRIGIDNWSRLQHVKDLVGNSVLHRLFEGIATHIKPEKR